MSSQAPTDTTRRNFSAPGPSTLRDRRARSCAMSHLNDIGLASVLSDTRALDSMPADRVRRSLFFVQVKRSSLDRERIWVSQKLYEHELAVEMLKDQLEDIREGLRGADAAVGRLLNYMDHNNIPIPNITDDMASQVALANDIDTFLHGSRPSRESAEVIDDYGEAGDMLSDEY
ncbi:hypothetical protein BC834DRAFT_889964 [Gloeopeniophorella convolvens]|nr:hypothetical protein BC834DRAFT_889964 [Gloeopeniophorella convolvens]